MALKHKIDTLDGLDEALKPLYAKGDDGRFTLQVDDAPATSTIAKLKAELEATSKALKEREGAEEKARKDAENAQLLAAGDFKKLEANLRAELEGKTKELETERYERNRREVQLELSSALAAHKGNQHLLKLVEDQFEAVRGTDGIKVLVKGDPTKTPAQYVEALKKDPSYHAFFEGTGASGAGSPSGGRPAPSGKTMPQSEFNNLSPKARVAFMAAGGSLTPE